MMARLKTIIWWTVTKLATLRRPVAVPRQLASTNLYITERDAAGIAISVRKLRDFYCIVDNDSVVSLVYWDGSDRSYHSHQRNAMVVLILDFSCIHDRCQHWSLSPVKLPCKLVYKIPILSSSQHQFHWIPCQGLQIARIEPDWVGILVMRSRCCWWLQLLSCFR